MVCFGAIVELLRFAHATGKERLALAVRSDLDLASQIGADGATWLDRQLVARTPMPLGDSGFGADVRDALAARAERLIEQGLAQRDGYRFVPARDLLGGCAGAISTPRRVVLPTTPGSRIGRARSASMSRAATASGCHSPRGASRCSTTASASSSCHGHRALNATSAERCRASRCPTVALTGALPASATSDCDGSAPGCSVARLVRVGVDRGHARAAIDVPAPEHEIDACRSG